MTIRRTLVALVILTLSLLLVSGRSHHPSILLITIDTLRPDRLGCYGHPSNRTPAIDRLAREGMVFERAYCDMPWTTGSMASVMTGQYSNVHGLRDPISKLAPSVATLAEILRDRGLQTAAIIGSFPLDSIYGLDRGFETYDDEFSSPMIVMPGAVVERMGEDVPDDDAERAKFMQDKLANDWFRPDEDVTDAALRWLDARREDQPFFLWVHYFGPHERLEGDVPPMQQEPKIVAAYDGQVEATDRAVGRLLDHLRSVQALDDVLVVLHADHGQNLGEHAYVGHTLRLDEVAVRIPLIVHYPRAVPAGLRRRDVARNVDILPTVLDAWTTYVGARPGRSLLPSPRDPLGTRVREERQIAYFETYITRYFFVPMRTEEYGPVLGPMERRGVRTPEWKFLVDQMVSPCSRGEDPHRDGFGAWALGNAQPLDESTCARLRTTELFRESGATGELEAVGTVPGDVLTALESRLDAHRAVSTAKGTTFTLTPDQERKLKSLGYLQ